MSAEQENEFYQHRLVDCLREAGWNAEYDPFDQGVRVDDVSGEQRFRVSDAVADCEQKIGRPQPTGMSSVEARKFFADLLVTAACLEREGYEVESPPSEETFLDSLDAGAPVWHPYMSIGNLPDAEWLRINEVCPQP